MKLKITSCIKALCGISILVASACNDEPSAIEKNTATLTVAEWSNPVVLVDGVDQSSVYQNFSIQFEKNRYTTKGGGPLWSPSGTWKFKDDTALVILFDGAVEATVTEISKSILEFSLENSQTTFAEGRIKSISGKNVFRLKSAL